MRWTLVPPTRPAGPAQRGRRRRESRLRALGAGCPAWAPAQAHYRRWSGAPRGRSRASSPPPSPRTAVVLKGRAPVPRTRAGPTGQRETRRSGARTPGRREPRARGASTYAEPVGVKFLRPRHLRTRYLTSGKSHVWSLWVPLCKRTSYLSGHCLVPDLRVAGVIR